MCSCQGARSGHSFFLFFQFYTFPNRKSFDFFFLFFLESFFFGPFTDFGKNLHIGRKIIALFRCQGEKFPVYSKSNHFIVFPDGTIKHPFWKRSVSDVGAITIMS